MPSRSAFLSAYRRELSAAHPWARDNAKLERFLASAEATLAGANTWNHDGECVTRAWHTIGGKGKPSLRSLHSLTT